MGDRRQGGSPCPRTAVSDRGCGSRYSYRLYGTDESEDFSLPPPEYRLMWYTDLLSSHRGTSENTPPHCCSTVLLSRSYFSLLLPLSLSFSSFLSLSLSLSRIPFLLLFLTISFSCSSPLPFPLPPCLSRFYKIISEI